MANEKDIAKRTLNRCNEQLGVIFERLEDLDESYFTMKIKNDAWSVIQIFNHLIESEQLTLRYLNYKKENKAVFERERFISKIKFSVMMVAYSFPIRFKAPKALSQPKNQGTLAEKQAEFQKVRTELLEFVENQPDSFFTLGSCKHPVVGKITLKKMFRFFHKHTAHHEKQVLRTLIKLSKD